MGDFIYFTDEQKERANAVAIADILQREHEEMERAGNEWRWKRHRSVTFRGNSWYRHSEQIGSHAIAFMQEFFGMNYPEAVTYLLNGEKGEIVHGNTTSDGKKGEKLAVGKRSETVQEQVNADRKPLVPPEKSNTMKRVYAYLIQKRHINREIISFFARQGLLYESTEHHNAVFVGVDKAGNIRHIHKKGTCSEGKGFRINEEGSDPSYGFGYCGKGRQLFVFEAPIDLLSYLTLYPENWYENSYIALNGVAEHAMLGRLREYPNLDTVILCLDHDAAGIEARGRLAEILWEKGYRRIKEIYPSNKDWNEDLKAACGEKALPAQEHPKIVECRKWMSDLKAVTASIDKGYAAKKFICRYYGQIYGVLKKGLKKENLESAFDGPALLLAGVLVRCMEIEGAALARATAADEILDNLQKKYRPHADKGNLALRIRRMQKTFDEIMEVFDTKDLSVKENKELLVIKYMDLTMECIKGHIFIATNYREPTCEPREHCLNDEGSQDGRIELCSQ